MNIHDAIKERHSVRRYANRPIEPEKLAELQLLIEQLNAESGLNMQLIVDDKKAFGSWLVHYGTFSGVSNYFALIGKDDGKLDEKVGFYGEQLVLRAQMLGLNTCWVGLTFKKNLARLNIGDGEKLRCVIALGYGQTQGKAHKTKQLEKVAQSIGPMPDWFHRGVEAALLAPTSLNQQKFMFILHEGNRVEALSGKGFFTKVDLGIVKYHFEIGAGKEHFEWITPDL